MGTSIYFWIGFHIFIFLMLALDLGVFHKRTHKLSVKEAITWSFVWITLALVFNLFIYLDHGLGHQRAVEFFTGYVIEYSLSVDNIFVFLLIFSYFSVKEEYQHKILFWGILGALVMRGLFILAGVTLINRFHWIVLIFGAFLLYTGIGMIFRKDVSVDPEKNAVVRFFRKFLPVSETLHGDRLFIRRNRMLYATPLFLVLLIIESSDLIFAVDSIPAILAISKHPFIVYTSNIFAIMGLRSLYFAIAGVMRYFRFLKYGLAFILSFVGIKMLISYFGIEIHTVLSLLIIVGILIVTILSSVLVKGKNDDIR